MSDAGALSFLAVVLPAAVALYVGARTAGATQDKTLSERLSSVEQRLDESEAREGKLVRYIYTLWSKLSEAHIEVPEPPEGLDL